MDSFKKPETVISLFNTAALLSASIYFYKKINSLEVELNKHSENLTSTVKKVREIGIYKKHIAVLGNALKELNSALGSSYRDIEVLKEIVKYQANQIDELKTGITKLDPDNKIEFKLKENPHLRSLSYYQAPQNPAYLPSPQPYSQPYVQPGKPMMQEPVDRSSPYPPQPVNRSSPYPPQPVNRSSPYPPQPNYPSPNYHPQPSQPHPSDNYNGSHQQPYGQPRFSSSLLDFDSLGSDNIDDEDAAIDAVRARRGQGNQGDPFFG